MTRKSYKRRRHFVPFALAGVLLILAAFDAVCALALGLDGFEADMTGAGGDGTEDMEVGGEYISDASQAAEVPAVVLPKEAAEPGRKAEGGGHISGQTEGGETEIAGQWAKATQEILKDMTIEEKVGQMFIARCPETEAAGKAKEYHLGGYIVFARDFKDKTADEVREEIHSWQSVVRIPMLIGVDEEGGTVNRVSRYQTFRSEPFPSPQELYESGALKRLKATPGKSASS